MDFTNLTNEQKLGLLEEIKKQKAELAVTVDAIKAIDPFWHFKPSTGELTEDAAAFLRKWLQPEDIPASMDGQLAVFKSTAQIVIALGGNQAGKTIMNAVKSHIKITGEIPASLRGLVPAEKLPTKWPVYGRVYAPSNSMIDEVMVPKFQEWMPRKYWHTQGWERTYNKQDRVLRYFKDGVKFVGQIKFISHEMDVSKTQGVSLDFAHPDEELPYEFYKELLPRFTTNSKKRVDIEFFMTPTNGISWVKEVLIDSEDPQVEVFKIPSVTNPYASLEVIDTMLRGLDTNEERKMRLLGEFVSLSGLIYKGDTQFRRDVHLIAPFELDYHRYVVFRGLDVHLSKPTCCVEMAVDPLGNKYVVGVYEENADTEIVKRELARRTVERRYRLGPTRYDRSLDYEIKALGDINIIQKLKMPPNQIPAMFPSEKYKGSIDAGIDTIKQDLRPDKFTGKPKLFFFDTPEVWKLIHDIQTLERDRGMNEDKKGQRDRINEGRRDRHAAFRYIFQNDTHWYPEDEDGGPQEPETDSYI